MDHTRSSALRTRGDATRRVILRDPVTTTLSIVTLSEGTVLLAHHGCSDECDYSPECSPRPSTSSSAMSTYVVRKMKGRRFHFTVVSREGGKGSRCAKKYQATVEDAPLDDATQVRTPPAESPHTRNVQTFDRVYEVSKRDLVLDPISESPSLPCVRYMAMAQADGMCSTGSLVGCCASYAFVFRVCPVCLAGR